MKGLKYYSSAVALFAAICIIPTSASAGAIGVVGTTGFGIVGGFGLNPGGIGNATCATCVFTSQDAFAFVFADGLAVSGVIAQRDVEVAGVTTSALMRVTNLTFADIGLGAISDTMYFFGDQFDPSIAGSAGVGIIGQYQSTAGFLGDIPYASAQAQMNYVQAIVAPGVPVGFSLTTPATFVTCVVCSPVGFWESARVPLAPGGVQELVGALGVTLQSGSAVVLPGSVLIDDNDPTDYLNEVAPEPGTVALLGSSLIGLVALARRRRRA